MEPRFPLHASALPRLRVDKPTLYAWKCAAREEVAALLSNLDSWYYKGQEPKYAYKLIYNKKGLEGYICTTEAARRKEFYACGILKMYLEDVSFGLYAENTQDQRGVSAFLDEDAFLDAAVLCVDERQTLEDTFHFAGVKWAASNSPTDVTTHADMVYFEYAFTTRDADGRTVLVQYLTCPDLDPSQVLESDATRALARGKNHQITTFRADEEGTYCQSSGMFLASEQIPSWVGMKTVLQAFSSLNNLVGLADARAVSRLKVASALSAAKACYLCKKKFSMLRTRQNCRSCGHSICKHCTVKLRFLNEDGLNAPSHAPLLVEDKFCLPCVRRAREQRPECDDMVAHFVDSIVSESSSNKTTESSFDDLAGHDDDAAEESSASRYDISDDSGNDYDDDDERALSLSMTAMRIQKKGSQRRGLVNKGSFGRQASSSPAQDEPAILYEPPSNYYSSKYCPVLESPRGGGDHTYANEVSPVMAFIARSRAQQQQQQLQAPSGPPPSYTQLYADSDAGDSSRSRQGLYLDGGDARWSAGSARSQFSASGGPVAAATGGAYPEPAANAFNKLTQSIAAQEALLLNIEQERLKLNQYRRAARGVQQQQRHVAPSYYHNQDGDNDSVNRGASSKDDDSRFEVISEVN